MASLARYVLVPILVLLPSRADAQEVAVLPGGQTPRSSEAVRPFQFQSVTGEDGLSQSTVQAIAQDEFGFLWFGTQSGLNRYDGQEMEVYHSSAFDSTSLNYRSVTALHSDHNGSLWVGTLVGLQKMDPATGVLSLPEKPDHEPVRIGGPIHAIASDSQGVLWVASSGGLTRLDPLTGEVTQHTPELEPVTPGVSCQVSVPASRSNVSSVLIRVDGTVWAGTNTGVARVDAGSGLSGVDLRDEDSTPIATGRVTSMVESDSGLWLASLCGVFHLDTTTGIVTTHTIGPDVDESPRQLMHDPFDATVLWLAVANSGLYRLEVDRELSVEYRHVAGAGAVRASDRIQSLAADHSGIIWVGTASSGLVRFDPRQGGFEYIHPGDDEYPDRRFVASVHEDRAGGLWIGTMNPGLLTRIDRDSGRARQFWEHQPLEASSLSPGRINAILEDSGGNFWIGTEIGGLNRLGPSRGNDFRHYRHDPANPRSLATDSLTIIHEDRSGRIWIAFLHYGVLDRYEPASDDFSRFQLGEALRSGSTYALHEDRDGAFWIGNQDLVRFDPQTGTIIDRFLRKPGDPEFFQGASSGILRDANGIVWITSLQTGLSRLDPDTREFKHFTPENSDLPDNELYHVLEDADGYLWISSNHGLSRFDPTTEAFVNYTRGLQSLEFNTFAAYESPRTGEMFFGGVNGVEAFFPTDFRRNTIAPKVFLADLKVANQSVVPSHDEILTDVLARTSEITVSHTDNDLSIDFAALHFKNARENRYAFQLEPYDRDSTRTPIPTATYTNLDPGVYTFRAWAANSDGVWSQPRALQITIRPPWWQWLWLRLVGLGVLLGLVTSGYNWRLRAIKERSEQLRQEVLDRTAEVSEQKDRLQEQATRLVAADAVKSRFFANISHEFRTPLTLTFGPLDDALSGRFTSFEQARPHFERARRNGGRLLRLINQLLDLSRLDAGAQTLQLTRVDLADRLRELAALFDSLAVTRDLDFATHLPEEGFPWVLDGDKIEKVVVNLLSNAFKFTHVGGRVDLSLSTFEEGSAVIVVADTGPGIEAQHLPLLFDRFYQVESQSTRSHEGSGIGLSLVKEFVELHGGSVHVESTVGVGTRFTIKIPTRDPEAVDAHLVERGARDVEVSLDMVPTQPEGRRYPAQETGADPLDEDSALVLVVEDNADMRSYIRAHLETSYVVVEAENGSVGIEMARDLVPDLILSDVMMPVMDGIDFCRVAKTDERTSHIPIILLTARAEVADRIEGFESGADAYMPKPFNAEELGVRIKALIAERTRLQKLFTSVTLQSADQQTDHDVSGLNQRELVFLEKARSVVEAHLDDGQFGVDRFAEELSISRRQLLRKLRALTDESAVSLIRRIRMQRAAELLLESELSIKEIRYAVGFQSGSSFTRTFREAHGMAPTEYALRHEQR
jgi:signal transduction histidine kinase/ligand-binding sensor domain-containing protein/DNA-binding response OmpR family regulator